jgi:hypothetical protein
VGGLEIVDKYYLVTSLVSYSTPWRPSWDAS